MTKEEMEKYVAKKNAEIIITKDENGKIIEKSLPTPKT